MHGKFSQSAKVVRARAQARRSAPTAPRSPQGTTPGTAQADSTPTLRASPRRGPNGPVLVCLFFFFCPAPARHLAGWVVEDLGPKCP